ncbi:hypothetical protein [Oceanospirillum sanctuarii]|uniref:hypothetical protein n=1 Tax=Oceanospirillum sanctuarii TaxID=1434821 RepID=UPI000A37DAA6|nr:hypothetical protein [Oceanospirillum sanctuarii]
MTLVIAGYEHEKSVDYSRFSDEARPYVPEMKVDGLFAIADSAITSHQGGRTILNGFRKVYEMEARLWKPDFMPDGSFRGYSQVYEKRPFFIGFAGSTLTAQHILNSISEHLGRLRISYSREGFSDAIKYEVIRHCQKNPLDSRGISNWDDDTFLDNDFKGLLKGEVIANFVEYSINEALHSASRYKLSMAEFEAMHTEFVCGTWCPYEKRHELYLFRMRSKRGEDGVLVAFTEKQLVETGEVVVLGMHRRFGGLAQDRFNLALTNFKSPASEIYGLLEECIDEIQNEGSKEIDRPISFRRLNRQKITRVK